MARLPENRAPVHPGEILRHEFLEPLGLTQTELAERLHVPFQRVNELVNGRRGVTPGTAIRLARLFGTTPALWMNLQSRYDLWQAQGGRRWEEVEAIEPLDRPDLQTA